MCSSSLAWPGESMLPVTPDPARQPPTWSTERLAFDPGDQAVPIPEVRRPDEEAVAKLRRAWERHGFRPVGEGVYAMALD
ncbi:hypothetical protein GCM10010442_04540 [Kitasatospora kifunensis]